jgi:hypothetical protein
MPLAVVGGAPSKTLVELGSLHYPNPRAAVGVRAVGMIILHNHPSGHSTSNREDVAPWTHRRIYTT